MLRINDEIKGNSMHSELTFNLTLFNHSHAGLVCWSVSTQRSFSVSVVFPLRLVGVLYSYERATKRKMTKATIISRANKKKKFSSFPWLISLLGYQTSLLADLTITTRRLVI